MSGVRGGPGAALRRRQARCPATCRTAVAGRAIESLGAAPGKQLPMEGDLWIVGDGQSELAEGEQPRLARQHGVIVGDVLPQLPLAWSAVGSWRAGAGHRCCSWDMPTPRRSALRWRGRPAGL